MALFALIQYLFLNVMTVSVRGLVTLLNLFALTKRIASVLALPDHKMQRQDYGSQEERGVKIANADFSWKSKISGSG